MQHSVAARPQPQPLPTESEGRTADRNPSADFNQCSSYQAGNPDGTNRLGDIFVFLGKGQSLLVGNH